MDEEIRKISRENITDPEELLALKTKRLRANLCPSCGEKAANEGHIDDLEINCCCFDCYSERILTKPDNRGLLCNVCPLRYKIDLFIDGVAALVETPVKE